MKALVLSGGGARGAYQVGVLKAVSDLARHYKIKAPFKIYTGVSAGAISAGFLASGADDFSTTADRLVQLWSGLTSENVFRTDAVSLGKIGLQWMGGLSFGGAGSSTPGKSLLDTTPLGSLIRDNMDFTQISKNIESGLIYALAVTALDYRQSTAITFVEGKTDHPEWRRARRQSENVKIQTEHILASSAIPLLFLPAQVDKRWFGDGCVRNSAPLSPALHLGASQLLIIGVRKVETTAYDQHVAETAHKPPSVARIANVILNSVLLDGIEMDIERLNRINTFLEKVPKDLHDNLNFKPVDYIWVHPSEDIGQIAASMSSRLPRVIRYLLKGLGPIEDASEIVSYLLFEPDFCKKLIEIGYKDGMSQKEKISQFLISP
jgi:NTE family protein